MLIVGEGAVEEAFLTHAKTLYVPRGCGLSVKVSNAHGKGASHVVEWTRRQIDNIQYDSVAVLLDTDTDWTPTVEKRARQKKITVMESTPCIEALLLRMLGQNSSGDSRILKKRYAPYVNNAPTDPTQYAKHFGDPILQASRKTEPAIDALLTLLNQR
ncbi:MAG: hypothetical protein Q8R21_05400 [Burkholderiales bacterium]|nr:hypothetical protein [Burkholderiales bacterium]